MGTTIYVMTHKKADFPNVEGYQPLHVGKAAAGGLGYPGDDTGDNISLKNNRFGELTGLYWIWKNSPEQGNVGLCHYRRYFLNEAGDFLTRTEYEKRLKDYDVIVSKEIDAGKPYLEYYNDAHDPRQQELVREAVDAVCPEYLPAYDTVMGQPFYYYGNLCVMDRERLNAYCEWLFGILFYVESRLDVSGYDAYHGRVYGFLSEQLLRVWITRQELKVYEAPIGITGEKTETKELKLAMAQLVKMGEYKEARKMFYEVLQVRPDLALELSDIKGEIPVIECVLYILDMEEDAGETKGMKTYSTDLVTLVAHYKKLSAIIADGAENTKDARQYLKDTCTTEIALETVRNNIHR